MKFIKTEPNENLNILRFRCVENPDLELGIYRVMYGMRVAISCERSHTYLKQYCCGLDPILAVTVFALLEGFLSRQNFDCDLAQALQELPVQHVRPMTWQSEEFVELLDAPKGGHLIQSAGLFDEVKNRFISVVQSWTAETEEKLLESS